ncbi:MAG: enoyl-CoA hydratase-related protein [Pseudomonadales bacterium]|jgi:enoyl-CoA hydratase/carnithine racemase|nr:enoyl-CoA hydratase-related protein [Pseudomonadales bacterium]
MGTPRDLQDVDYRVEDGVAVVTLDRPNKMNAWTGAMDAGVYQCMQAATEDDAVRVIVLTGNGRGFCAGADMENLLSIQAAAKEGSQDGGIASGAEDRRIDKSVPAAFGGRYSYFASVPKPVICAVNGACAGMGMAIALFTDLRLWSSEGRMSTIFAKRGLIAEWGLTWTLNQLCNPAVAADLLFSARFVGAEEALRIGLANAVYPKETFMDDVMAYAKDMATNVSPRSLRVMKQQLWNDVFGDLQSSLDRAETEMKATFGTEDFKEGVAHFVEKRAPRFTGQ